MEIDAEWKLYEGEFSMGIESMFASLLLLILITIYVFSSEE